MATDANKEYDLALSTGDANYISTAAKGVNAGGATDGLDTSGDDGDGGYDAMAIQRDQQAWEERMAAAATKREQDQTIAQVQAIFSTYGLNSLYTKIVDFVRQGYTGDTVSLLLRQTPEYKQRFPAMAALSAKNRAITEAEYINYESTSAALERRYGLPKDMLMGNVTTLLENEVSPAELNDRVMMASASSIQAPKELKDQFKQYYGIDEGGLTAYFLDPAIATPLLQKQVAASQIGTEAARQGIGIDAYGAENLQQLGIDQQAAREGFSNVAQQKGLSSGAGDIATQSDLIGAQFGANAEAKKNVERAAGGRLGRFQGGGEFLQTQKGAVGLGSAATR